MVRWLTYRKRHSYATKSNQTRVVKTPAPSHFVLFPMFNTILCLSGIVLIGEIGGMAEEDVATFIQVRRTACKSFGALAKFST
ncbi:hypothetical protein Zm00014a_002211 [Zea mays]|uniref:Uncharacterized protein n=1 Tax=Zea mays TaxID=4577 RepID=A0A3L6DPD4_MAIZE|nr:hypothetical protein Zm00014a_002211 [Zea mays]